MQPLLRPDNRRSDVLDSSSPVQSRSRNSPDSMRSSPSMRQSPLSRSPVTREGERSLGEDVHVSMVGSDDYPPGFNSLRAFLGFMPADLRPVDYHVGFRHGTETERTILAAIETLKPCDMRENTIGWIFETGESRPLFDALVTLGKYRLLELARNTEDNRAVSTSMGLSLVHLLAKNGKEPPVASGMGGISLRERFAALREAGVNLEMRDNRTGYTPLHLAARANNWESAEALLASGVKVDSRCDRGMTPLMHAAETVSLNAMHSLLEAGAKPNLLASRTDANGEARAAIHWAASTRVGGLSGLHKLITKGADVNLPSERGLTPLHYAIRHHQFRNVEVLARAKADPNIQDRDGDTLLHIACGARDAAMVSTLLAVGANPNLDDRAGQKPLYRAVKAFASIDIIRALIDGGADVNAENRVQRRESFYGWKEWQLCRPVLHLICDFEFTPQPRDLNFDYLAEVGKLLLEKGADPEKPDLLTGETAIHCAARRINKPMIEQLVEVGHAKIDALNYKGQRALDIASKMGFSETFALLVRLGALPPHHFTPYVNAGSGGGGG